VIGLRENKGDKFGRNSFGLRMLCANEGDVWNYTVCKLNNFVNSFRISLCAKQAFKLE
jgi:hypothetical protein